MNTLVLFLTIFVAYTTASSYCVVTGCDTGECTCPPFFFSCDTHSDKNGVCTFTRMRERERERERARTRETNIIEWGIWLSIFIFVGLVAVIAALVLIVCCCCCCKGCRKKSDNIIQLHSSYPMHQNL